VATADDSEAQQPEGTTRYAVRLTPRADREAIEAAERLADIAGSEEVGRGWYGALLGTVGTLATNPTRFAVQERESRLLARPVRRLVYRYPATSHAAFHVYFTVREASEDGPRVTVIHIRHAARKPLTTREARNIEPEMER
jgi:hypothetical protein